MGNTYDRKERMEKRARRYNLILSWIKEGVLSRREIMQWLDKKDLKIGEHALKKDYLDKMIEKREIGSINKSFEHKDYKKIFELAYGKRWDKKLNIYYIHTPRSEKFYNELRRLAKDALDKKRALMIVDHTSELFRGLEIYSEFEKERHFNERVIKSVLTDQGIDPTLENINLEKRKNHDAIMLSNQKGPLKLTSDLGKYIQKVNGKDYLLLRDDKLVEVEKLDALFDILLNHMNHVMLWVSCTREAVVPYLKEQGLKEKRIYILLLELMFNFFGALYQEPSVETP